jgi:hypothetical protein
VGQLRSVGRGDGETRLSQDTRKQASSKTARFDLNVWFNDRTGHIHLAAGKSFISTVSNDPASRRYHPNLYRKLAFALRDKGMPHPALTDGDGETSP